MRCKSCNNEIADDSTFCIFCAAAMSTVTGDSANNDVSDTGDAYIQPSGASPIRQPRRNSKIIIIIGLVVFLLGGVAIGLYEYYIKATRNFFTDSRDGRKYKTVKIGTQTWMAENLNVSHFRNGAPIPEAKTNKEWTRAGKGGKPAWCCYDNEPGNGEKYGKLYNWYAVNDKRNICPTGWHVPTDTEWKVLSDYLGGESVAGGKMKEAGIIHWASPNTGATNSSGFTALSGGCRRHYADCRRHYGGRTFRDSGNYGYWWSTAEYESDFAGGRILFYSDATVHRFCYNKEDGFSVRCLKDNIDKSEVIKK
ncbi:MAG: fibrobacter succinogenes major paralogous domain-containing protein [Bacteroidia bacterium]|nr:fibrobacter succinogenes major paralogous domain-containing protein [Bacteroidia bacterium]